MLLVVGWITAAGLSASAGISALFENSAVDSIYEGASYGNMALPSVQSGGPDGNYYQLQPSGIGLLSNTLNFDPSGANTSQITAQFDFRMNPGTPASGDGFGFSIYDVAAYGDFAPPEDFTQADINDEIVVWEQPRWNEAFSVGFDLVDGAFEIQKNMITLNANGRRISAAIVGSDLDDGLFHRVTLDLENAGDDAVASLSFTRDVYGAADNQTIFDSESVLGYNIPGSGLPTDDPTGWGVAFGARTGGATVGVDLDNILVNAEPVPEPITGLLLFAAAFGGFFIRRRRF